jgi:hypothetical protein
MKTKSGLALLALGLLVIAPTAPVDAQGIRGLIKKKAEESVRKPEAAPAEEMPGALRDPDVVPINEETLGHFRRGLDVEIAERAALTKFLAGIKTREQYRACTTNLALSPEGQKIAMRMSELPENATPAQMQAVITKMNEEMNALALTRCGEDPVKYLGNWRAERLREIEAKAAAAAGPPADSDLESWSAFQPTGPAAEQAALDPPVARTTLVLAGMTPRQYALYKERVIAFCQAIQNGWKPPATPIVTMPGTGNGKWVFTQDEVQDLLKHCQTLMQLLTQVT